jgi:hypothetical protein
LGEVATLAPRCGNCGDIRHEAIGADLELLVRSSGAQPIDKGIRGGLAAAPQGAVQNQLAVAFYCHEAVGVANGIVVSFGRRFVSFLLLHEAPDFVTLNEKCEKVMGRLIVDVPVKDAVACL